MSQENRVAARIGLTTLIQAALSVLATLAFAFGALTGYRWVGFALGAAVLAGLAVLFARRGPVGSVSVQLLVLGGFLVDYDRTQDSHTSDIALLITSVLIMGLLLNQATYNQLLVNGQVEVAHLPGLRLGSGSTIKPAVLIGAPAVLVAIAGVSAAARAPVWPLVGFTLLVAAAYGLIAVQLIRRRAGGHHAQAAIRTAVEEYAPEFALYFSAPMGSEYHVTMWLPYLESLGRPFVIVTRESEPFATFAAAAKVPVIVCKSVAEVDNLIVGTMRAAFYVNNGMKNVHMVRFNQLKHIQLLHGDSDKASSYNPVTTMFDRVYVAGQAGIDRYAANHVFIDPEKFVIVGRPQVGTIKIATRPIREISPPTVMYATTWSGLYADANYCSLEIGPEIVAELLRRNATVIFRPHPLTRRTPAVRAIAAQIDQMLAADRARTGRAHLYGTAATTGTSLFECIDRADALISDVSGVASDFLYSEKPLALTDMLDDGPHFAEKYPLARAAYVLRKDGGNLAGVLDDLLATDPLAETRRGVKHYYLGDFPAEAYADAFSRAALAELLPAGVEPVEQPAVSR